MLHVQTAAEKKAEKLAKKWAKENRLAKLSPAEREAVEAASKQRLATFQANQWHQNRAQVKVEGKRVRDMSKPREEV